MKKFLLKILGLSDLDAQMLILVLDNARLEKAVKDLTDEVNAIEERVTEKLEEVETPDMDEYVLHSDLDDNIESYLNNNDYVTTSYVDDEIESKVEDAVDEKISTAIDELDITVKVEDAVKEMDKASFGDTEELEGIVRKEVKSFMLNSVKIDFIVR